MKHLNQQFPPTQTYFALGTVGWDQDTVYYDIGTQGTDKTLVKVTLVWGRNPTQPVTGVNAQGSKVLATLPGPIFHLPALGDLVELAIPKGMERMPGAATIRGWHKPTPVGFDANNAMWPIANGQFAVIGDSNAVAAALGTICKAWFDDIKTKFEEHTHGYVPGTLTPVVTTPPTIQPSSPFTPFLTLAASGDPRAQKVKIT